jgi:hypothetical protein
MRISKAELIANLERALDIWEHNEVISPDRKRRKLIEWAKHRLASEEAAQCGKVRDAESQSPEVCPRSDGGEVHEEGSTGCRIP